MTAHDRYRELVHRQSDLLDQAQKLAAEIQDVENNLSALSYEVELEANGFDREPIADTYGGEFVIDGPPERFDDLPPIELYAAEIEPDTYGGEIPERAAA